MICCRPDTDHAPLIQAAAEETARQHPGGIDFLVVLAGIVDSKHKGAIETCAAAGRRLFVDYHRARVAGLRYLLVGDRVLVVLHAMWALLCLAVSAQAVLSHLTVGWCWSRCAEWVLMPSQGPGGAGARREHQCLWRLCDHPSLLPSPQGTSSSIWCEPVSTDPLSHRWTASHAVHHSPTTGDLLQSVKAATSLPAHDRTWSQSITSIPEYTSVMVMSPHFDATRSAPRQRGQDGARDASRGRTVITQAELKHRSRQRCLCQLS